MASIESTQPSITLGEGTHSGGKSRTHAHSTMWYRMHGASTAKASELQSGGCCAVTSMEAVVRDECMTHLPSSAIVQSTKTEGLHGL